MLITGGNLYSEFMGDHIGTIDLEFQDGKRQSIKLIAGDNIREWKLLDSKTVFTVTSNDSQEVW